MIAFDKRNILYCGEKMYKCTMVCLTEFLREYARKRLSKIKLNSLVCHAFKSFKKVHSRTVDTTAGALFDVEINDVNGDGREDLLVVSNGMNGSVLVYEIPSDFRLVEVTDTVQHEIVRLHYFVIQL